MSGSDQASMSNFQTVYALVLFKLTPLIVDYACFYALGEQPGVPISPPTILSDVARASPWLAPWLLSINC